jgi:hypothetical protein
MNYFLFQLKRNPLAIIGIAVLLLWILIAIFGPYLVSFTYTEIEEGSMADFIDLDEFEDLL